MRIDQDAKVKSLYKALMVLDCFSAERQEIGVSEIARELKMSKGSVYNILSTFESCGYIVKNPVSEKYGLSFKVLELSHLLVNKLGFRDAIYPHLKELSELLGETVFYGIPDKLHVLYLEVAYPAQAALPRPRMITGEKAPLYCTGIGKAMLAFMPQEDIDKVTEGQMRPFTDNTLIKPEALRADLEETKRRGYALDNMEHEFGVCCVAVPVLDSEGQLVAGISTSGPSLRFGEEKIPFFCQSLKKTAAIIANLHSLY